MKLERRVYTTRDQKVGDFMIGVGLFIALNIVLAVLYAVLATAIGVAIPYTSSASQTIANVLNVVLGFVPFIINIGIIVYFGLTRYWIALGMLGGFAVSLLVVLILGAACFALIAGLSSTGN